MHEFSIARELVRAALAAARHAEAARVTAMRCRIGVLRQIDDDMLRAAFSAASDGTPCGEAELIVEKIPLRAHCAACGSDFAILHWNWTCPVCRQEGNLLPGGDELELISIDVEAEHGHPSRPEALTAK